MAITSGDSYIAAGKQKVRIVKTASAVTVAAQWHTLVDRAGNPGAGTLAVGNTTTGVVPDDTVAGYPALDAFGGLTGYLSIVDFSNTIACRLAVYDRLWHAGAVNLNALATTTFTTQPSYAARLPGTSYSGLAIWLEIGTTVSATATTVNVTYVNEAGVAAHTTGATASLSGFVTGRLIQMPLQAGDKGVQQITSVTVGGTVATAGTFNVIVARPLWTAGRVPIANGGDVHGIDKTGMPIVYDTSALWPIISADATSSGVPDLLLEVARA